MLKFCQIGNVNRKKINRQIKMPHHTEGDDEHIKQLVKGGGLKDYTLIRRQKIKDEFTKFVWDTVSVSLEELLGGEMAVLEKTLIGYFESMRVVLSI